LSVKNLMKKTMKLTLLAVFVGFTSLAFGQGNRINLDELAQAVRANPGEAAALVEEAVRNSPEQITAITDRLMASFPGLTEEIVFGAIAGMPTPLSEDALTRFLNHVVAYRPGATPEIVSGARRATSPAMAPVITAAVRNALQLAIGENGLGVIGRTSESSVASASFNPSLRIISPAQ
jgi:outer membrane murein-binding lipoprotein Lpp